MSHETYSFGAYTGIAEDNYNQQLKFDFKEKRKIKEIVKSYYEETDSEGKLYQFFLGTNFQNSLISSPQILNFLFLIYRYMMNS